MWRTTFAFQNWHSAIELKRYFLRFLQEFPRIHTLAGVRRTRLNQYDSIVRPLTRWLTEQGVTIEHGTRVSDADFFHDSTSRRLTELHLQRDGREESHRIGEDDLVFLTLGSMTADAIYGDDNHAPLLNRDKADGAWTLWETIARKAPDLGRPQVFSGNVEQAKWESFTLAMRSPTLLHRIQEFTGNLPGTGGLVTFKDSAWLMSIVVPHQPHFDCQPEDQYTLWGYGLFVDEPGDYIGPAMSAATGQEILTELLHQLGFEDALEEISATTTVIPVMMPCITSQFAARNRHDRPLVIPRGSENFAFLGQYVEIPEDVVFTVEYSVRGAMHAVYELMGIHKPIPGIYHAMAHPAVAFDALRTALG
jgi:oleate hydratase